MLKIAFLFLTVGPIYHEQLWHDFFAENESRFSVYVHAKKALPEESFFKKYEMKDQTRTTWSHTMRAQIHMLKEALKDPSNEKFVFISETTIPLRSFNDTYTALLDSPESMFYFAPNPHAVRNAHQYNPQNHRNLKPIPTHQQYKNAQWIVLNRKHAELMVEDTKYIAIAEHYGSDQEHYPATFLVAKGLWKEIIPVDMTFVDWSCDDPPYIFTDFGKKGDLDLMKKVIDQGYLFVRKVHPTCNLTPLEPYLPYKKTQLKTANTTAELPTPLAEKRATGRQQRATINQHDYKDAAITFGASQWALDLLK